MSFQATTIELPLNVTPAGIGIALNNFFLSAGNISITGIRLFRRPSTAQGQVSISIAYRDPGSSSYFAIVFVGDENQSADQKANTFFDTIVTRRGWYVLDVSPELRRSMLQDAMCIIINTEIEAECGVNNNRPRLVSPINPIASGAIGEAGLFGRIGIFTNIRIDVINRSDFTWNPTEPGWAILNVVDCTWDGFPTCCHP